MVNFMYTRDLGFRSIRGEQVPKAVRFVTNLLFLDEESFVGEELAVVTRYTDCSRGDSTLLALVFAED